MRAVIVASAIAATVAAMPKDPCALLKPSDIQALAPNAKIGGRVLTENGPLGGTCAYRWGPRTSEWGETALSVTVVDASKVGGNALAQKDKLIALLKAAAAAL